MRLTQVRLTPADANRRVFTDGASHAMVGSMSVSDLYDEDFYLWTQAQAEALRAEARRRGSSNELDWAHLAEEVGDLGKSDLRECLSRTSTIIEHLLKLASSGQAAPRAGWLVTIKTQRNALKRVMTASIRAKVEADLDALHEEARDIVTTSFSAEEPGVQIDKSLAWSLPAILGEADDPIGK
jgi:hypothetical protein